MYISKSDCSCASENEIGGKKVVYTADVLVKGVTVALSFERIVIIVSFRVLSLRINET